MDPATCETTVLVLGEPAGGVLARLEAVRSEVDVRVGKTAEALGDAVNGAQVLFNWSGPKPEVRRVMEIAPKLEWIHTRAVGVDLSLFPALIESPITLTNGRGVFSQSLGEFVILGALYFAKDVPRMNKAKAERRWEVYDNFEISRQTMGVIGYGDIGRAVARRAQAMGMRVLALRRDLTPREGDQYVDRVYGTAALHELLPQCDYVVVTAPLTPETKGMMGRREFGLMKPGSVIMNVGRGPVIDEGAMVEALESGHLGGAALDVFEVEPLPRESPLWRMDNVLLSAHTADHTQDWHADAMTFFLEQLARWRKGEPLRNIVDKRAGY